MRSIRILVAVLILGVAAAPCWSQFVRVPVVPRLPHIPHIPIPHVFPDLAKEWVLGGATIAGVGGGALLVRAWRKRRTPRAVVRITALPPGEAPEWVRQAWIGLELPLVAGQVRAGSGNAQGVLSGEAVAAPPAYAVEGRAAIAILQAACPDAAAWWRENVPLVLASGSQLVFPAEVCERLDDLGSSAAA